MNKLQRRWTVLSRARKTTVILLIMMVMVLAVSQLLRPLWPNAGGIGWVIGLGLTITAFVLSFRPARRKHI